MYELFQREFHVDSDLAMIPSLVVAPEKTELGELLSRFGGQSFNRGLYRVMRNDAIDRWDELVVQAFHAFSGRTTCFAYDWLGRIFAIDAGRLVGGKAGVVM